MTRVLLHILFDAANTDMGESEDSSTPLDRVKLINAGFDAFAAIALTCEPGRSLDYRTVAVSLYNGKSSSGSDGYDVLTISGRTSQGRGLRSGFGRANVAVLEEAARERTELSS